MEKTEYMDQDNNNNPNSNNIAISKKMNRAGLK